MATLQMTIKANYEVTPQDIDRYRQHCGQPNMTISEIITMMTDKLSRDPVGFLEQHGHNVSTNIVEKTN